MQWYFQLGNWEESINSIKLYLCDTAVLIKLCCLFFFCWLVGWFGFFLVSSSKMNCMVKTKVGDNQVKEYIQVTATSNAWQQLSATSDVLLAGRLAKYSTWHVIKRWFMLTNNFRLPETHLLPCFVWMQSGLEKKNLFHSTAEILTLPPTFLTLGYSGLLQHKTKHVSLFLRRIVCLIKPDICMMNSERLE